MPPVIHIPSRLLKLPDFNWPKEQLVLIESQVHAAFLRREGVCIVRPRSTLSGKQLRNALVNLSKGLGVMLPQDKSGVQVREVRYRGTDVGEGEISRYADSRVGGNFHTDGAEMCPPFPSFFVLACLSQSPTGGAFQYAHVEDIVSRLGPQSETVRILEEPFKFDRRGDQAIGESPTVEKPILSQVDGRYNITYLRKYIEIGHSRCLASNLTPAQTEALNRLDEAIVQPSICREYKLDVGEIMVGDNLHIVHARTAFRDPSLSPPRLLLRTWIRRH